MYVVEMHQMTPQGKLGVACRAAARGFHAARLVAVTATGGGVASMARRSPLLGQCREWGMR